MTSTYAEPIDPADADLARRLVQSLEQRAGVQIPDELAVTIARDLNGVDCWENLTR